MVMTGLKQMYPCGKVPNGVFWIDLPFRVGITGNDIRYETEKKIVKKGDSARRRRCQSKLRKILINSCINIILMLLF